MSAVQDEKQRKIIDTIKKNNYERPDFIVEDLETLNFKEKNGSVIIDYSYQRNFIQSPSSASRYVESVFLGLIIPEIQVYENKEIGCREVVDGQQRLLSLLKFLRNEYRLRGLKQLPILNGKKFKDLPEELQIIYKQFCMNMRVAKNPSEDYKYLLFERLNIGSKPLNQQEVRNCVFKENPVLKMTRRITDQECIVKLFEEVGRIKNDRFNRDEFILGLFSARYGDLSSKHTLLKDRINDYLLSTNNASDKDVEEMFTEFFDIIEVLASNYDMETILQDLLIRKSALESIVVAMWKIGNINIIKENSDEIEMALLSVISSDEFKESIGLGSAQANKFVEYRIELMLKEIKSVVA